MVSCAIEAEDTDEGALRNLATYQALTKDGKLVQGKHYLFIDGTLLDEGDSFAELASRVESRVCQALRDKKRYLIVEAGRKSILRVPSCRLIFDNPMKE